jgi:hypothetical protein
VMAADDRTWAPCWHCPAVEATTAGLPEET